MVVCSAVEPKRPHKHNNLANYELEVCPFTILVDQQEKMAWPFQGMLAEERHWIVNKKSVHLKTGDYSIEGYKDLVTIERKSTSDFLGSITNGRARFGREHERMADIVEAGGFACVVVEGDLAAICDEVDDPDCGRKYNSLSVIGTTACWPQRYWVPWFFGGDRRRAEMLAFRILFEWWHRHTSEKC